MTFVVVAGLTLAACSRGPADDEAEQATTVLPSTSSTVADNGNEPDNGNSADTGPGGGSDAVPGDGSAISPTIELADPELVDLLGRLPGRLAVGDANRLLVTNPDGSDAQWLQDQADVLATQPTWSRAGDRLAFGRIGSESQQLVVHEVATAAEQVSDLEGSRVFYLQWSVADDVLAYLRDDPGGQGIEMGINVPGGEVVPVVAGQPLYLSWSPSSLMMAAHINDSQVVVLPDLLTDPELGTPSTVLNPSGLFTVPAWIDESTLLAATIDGLALVDVNTNRSTLVAEGPAVQFVLSPDRTKVAFTLPLGVDGSPGVVQVQDEAGPGLQVVELASGDITTVTSATPLAWEWSPDSSLLAWLDLGSAGPVPRASWRFWDGTSSTSSVAHRISGQVGKSYIPFFEQYAQSHHQWSPDSTAFAFAGQIGSVESPEAIWVQLVGADVPPVAVAIGDFVTWSG